VKQDQALICVRVRPHSSHAELTLRANGELLVCVHAPASQGAANRECLAVLAKALGVAKCAVRIVRGQRSRQKQIAVEGIDAGAARARLEEAARAQGRPR